MDAQVSELRMVVEEVEVVTRNSNKRNISWNDQFYYDLLGDESILWTTSLASREHAFVGFDRNNRSTEILAEICTTVPAYLNHEEYGYSPLLVFAACDYESVEHVVGQPMVLFFV